MPTFSFVRLAAWLALIPGQGTYPSEFYISWCYGSECMNQTINAAHMQLQFESHYHHGARPPLKEVFMVVGAPQEMQQELLMSCPGLTSCCCICCAVLCAVSTVYCLLTSNEEKKRRCIRPSVCQLTCVPKI